MKLSLLATAAIAAATFGVQSASAEGADHTGIGVSLGATQFSGNYNFSGGKPSEELSGTLAVISLDADYQFGAHDGFVVGGSYFTSFGDGVQSPPVRDGNYLVQDGRIDKISGWELRAGYAWGQFEPYVAYGQTQIEGATRQSCPADWNAAPFGFCHGGGVPATGVARQGTREADISETVNTWSLGVNYAVTENWYFDVRYSKGDSWSDVVSLDPTGDTAGQTAHPPTDPHQDPSWWTIRTGWRF